VSWNWGSGQPSGNVVETKTEGEIAIKSKRGNTIKKNASPSNPAVHVGRSGNDVVKRASELNVEEKASGSTAKENGTADKKRDHDEVDGDDETAAAATNEAGDKPAEKEELVKKPAAKKQKKEPAAAGRKKKEKEEKPAPAPKEKKQANGDEPKKARGRPKGTGPPAAGGAAKKKDPKPRATQGIGSRTRSRA
jgi:Hypervirulence associated proteins TUDOR domain